MSADGILFTAVPIRLPDLVSAAKAAERPLGVQGIDRLGAAAILTPDGSLVCAIAQPALVSDPLEISRLCPSAAGQPVPCYWHDVRVGDADPALARELLDDLAARCEGHLELHGGARSAT